MAKTSNLRDFQEAILLRLKEASSKEGAVSTSRLGVNVGSKKVLINLNEVTEVLPVPPMQSVPLTQPWFLGVANVRGNLYNITDLAQFMGLPPTPKSANNRIILINSDTTTQAAIVIDSLVGLRSTETMKKKTSHRQRLPGIGLPIPRTLQIDAVSVELDHFFRCPDLPDEIVSGEILHSEKFVWPCGHQRAS